MNSTVLNRKMVRLGTAKPSIPNGRPVGGGTEKQTIIGQNKRNGRPVDSYKGWWPQKWPCTKDHAHENIHVAKSGKLYCSMCETEKRRERRENEKVTESN